MPFVEEKYDGLPPWWYWIGLVLRPIEGSRGTYERFRCSHVTEKGREAFQQAESIDLSEDGYIRSHGKAIYTVCII